MKKNIIVFSNPFGYGPTGTALPILSRLIERCNDSEVTFAGSNFCMEIVPNNFKKYVLDERNEEKLEEYLKSIKNPFVIGSQNRFCIKVARKLNIPCAFIDILAWFWKEIPADHLLADEIFWIKFPAIEDKIPKEYNNINLVSNIIRTPIKIDTKSNNSLIIHIGGAKYPPLNEIPTSYLNLLSKGINSLGLVGFNNQIIIAAGSDASNFLKKKVNISNAVFVQEDYIRRLTESSHVLTTSGVSSTFEAFSLEKPVSFLLPLNLSQVALLDMLTSKRSAQNFLDWCNYVKVDTNLRKMTEKDAIQEIKTYAKIVDENSFLSEKFVFDFIKLANDIPENKEQIELVKWMGNTGADEIVSILIDKWHI